MTTQFETSEKEPTMSWWGKKRLVYNIGLLISGATAFLAYCIVFELFILPSAPRAEITLLTTVFQSMLYLVFMGIANGFYFLGPLFEKITRPANVLLYRKTTFSLGLFISCAAPFIMPVYLIIEYA